MVNFYYYYPYKTPPTLVTFPVIYLATIRHNVFNHGIRCLHRNSIITGFSFLFLPTPPPQKKLCLLSSLSSCTMSINFEFFAIPFFFFLFPDKTLEVTRDELASQPATSVLSLILFYCIPLYFLNKTFY